ncbi:hypothetical protein BGZ73_005218 [Actinomortierella ambigua]|nr:hypothetical protein BGZ73_005218 [Actinomortierella ambigua]
MRRQPSLTPIKTKVSGVDINRNPVPVKKASPISSASTIASPSTAVSASVVSSVYHKQLKFGPRSDSLMSSHRASTSSPSSAKPKTPFSIARRGSIRNAVKAIEDSSEKTEKPAQTVTNVNDDALLSGSTSPPLSSTTLVASTPVIPSTVNDAPPPLEDAHPIPQLTCLPQTHVDEARVEREDEKTVAPTLSPSSLHATVTEAPPPAPDVITSPHPVESNHGDTNNKTPKARWRTLSSAVSMPVTPSTLAARLASLHIPAKDDDYEQYVQTTNEVMAWLKEAVETVSGLESKIQELEKDCESIPLYEKERQKMVMGIQELETAIQRDEQWRLQIKETIQRVYTDDNTGRAMLAALQYLRGIEMDETTEDDDGGDEDPATQHTNEKVKNDGEDDDEESPIDLWLRTTAQAIDEDKEKQQRARQTARHQLFEAGPNVGSTFLTVREPILSKEPTQTETGVSIQQLNAGPTQKNLHHSAATTTLSKCATVAGSRESFSTDLGCMLDERVYLKQHIQSLDGMLAREKEARTQAEQKHYRLAREMASLSRSILEQVNLLTVTYAVISESATPVLSSSTAVPTSTLSLPTPVHTLAPSPLLPSPLPPTSSSSVLTPTPKEASLRESSGISSSKTLLAASGSKGHLLQELNQMDQCMRRLRALAADCVQVVDHESPPHTTLLSNTNLAGRSGELTLYLAPPPPTVPLPPLTTTTTTGSLSPSPSLNVPSTSPSASSSALHQGHLQHGSHVLVGATSSMLRGLSSSSSAVNGSPAIVDGFSFQEFKDYLSAICSVEYSVQVAAVMAAQRSVPLSRAAAQPGPVLLLPAPWTAFMERVLEEDIKPCLLMPSRPLPSSSTTTASPLRLTGSSPFAKGWMRFLGLNHPHQQQQRQPASHGGRSTLPNGGSEFASGSHGSSSGRSSTPSPTSPFPSQAMANLSPWHQRLLEAVERNACEIVLWRASKPNQSTAAQTPALDNNTKAAVSAASSPPPPTTKTVVPIIVTNDDQMPTEAAAAAVEAEVASSQPPKSKCCLCGMTRTCEFRLRVVAPISPAASSASSKKQTTKRYHHGHQPDDSLSSPLPLDRFCRDRLVAVCDFFMFLAHLRQGLLNHYCVMDLYKRELLLRRRMACARMGAIDLFA